MVSKFGLFALGTAALVSASHFGSQQVVGVPSVWAPVAAAAAKAEAGPTSTSSSKGFQLAAIPTDNSHPLASSVHGMFLNAYHIGAGVKMAVLHGIDAHNAGAVFYLNKKPGHPESILTDAGPFPYSFSVPPPGGGGGVQGVMFPVGDVGTPVAIEDGDGDGDGNAGAPSKGIYVKNGLQTSDRGSFFACKRPVPYYHAELMVLEYAYDAPPQGCVPIQLVVQCATLPAPHPHSPASHEYAQTVPCYT